MKKLKYFFKHIFIDTVSRSQMHKFWRIARSSALVKKYLDNEYKQIEGKDINVLRNIDIHRRMLVRVEQVQREEINNNKKSVQELILRKSKPDADAAADIQNQVVNVTIDMRLKFISELKKMNKKVIEPIVVQIHGSIMILEKQRWLQQQQQQQQQQQIQSCDCIPGESGCDSCCNCNTVGICCVGCAHHGEHGECNCCSK